MAFCLVSKLKGEVNNNFLPAFGYQQLYFHTDRPIDITIEGLSYWGGTVADAKPYYLRGSGYFLGTDDANLGKEVVHDNVSRNLFKKIHLDGDAMFEIPNNAFATTNHINKFVISYSYINDVAVLNFDTGIIPSLFLSNQYYGFDELTLYADYISGKLSDIYPGPINNNMGFVNLYIAPKNQCPNFTGDLSDITFSNDKKAWPYIISIRNLPNLTGNLNTFFDRLAVAIARTLQGESTTTKTVNFTIKNCPGIFYNGESTGTGFERKVITFNQDGTRSE